MALRFEKRKLEVDLYGEILVLTYPTSKQLDDFLKTVNEISKGKSKKSELDATIEMLEKLGLPRKQAQEMEIQHLNELSDELLDANKKK